MRVLLLQPKYKDTWASSPLGLGYIASVLEADGHDVNFLDLTLTPLSDEKFKKYVNQINPGLIGISLMCRALPETRRMVAKIREVSNAPICLGGPQPTTLSEFTLEYTKADFAAIGEGEITLKELVHYLAEGKDNLSGISGLAFFQDNKVIINKPREHIKNLDQIPFPAWHLMPPSEYKIAPVLSHVKRYPIAPIVTTRGCPYRCNFCGGPTIWGRTFRMRSSKNVVDEIELLMKEYGVKEFFISDDNFTLIKEHTTEICKEILRRKLDIPWACPGGVRIDRLDHELLQIMKKAGCHLLGFGIESGDQEILVRAKKNLDLKSVSKVIKEAKEAGITTYGFFIMGLLGETPQTLRRTIDFAKSLPLDRAWFNILVPYPGTEIFNEFTRGRTLDEVDWENIDAATGMITSGIEYPELTAEDLVHWQRKAVREFYLRPKIIIDVLKNIRYSSLKTMVQTSFFKNLILKGRYK